MDRAVPIVGSPKPTSYDIMFCDSAIKTLRQSMIHKDARADLIRAFADFFWLALNSPNYYVKHVKPEEAANSPICFENVLLSWDANDMKRGLEAIATNDAYRPFGEDESAAAAAIKAKLLVIVASKDHCVNPAPALSLAQKLGAETIVFDDDEGHSSTGS